MQLQLSTVIGKTLEMQNGIMLALAKGDIIMGIYNCCRVVKAERILNLIPMFLPSWSHLTLSLAMIMCAGVQDPQEVPWRVYEFWIFKHR